ncbi:MAG: hypothetical protein C0511_14985 [Hyphomicrobium sp.]|nr:hypothetical protein [Hyphomicrobium sp.]
MPEETPVSAADALRRMIADGVISSSGPAGSVTSMTPQQILDAYSALRKLESSGSTPSEVHTIRVERVR